MCSHITQKLPLRPSPPSLSSLSLSSLSLSLQSCSIHSQFVDAWSFFSAKSPKKDFSICPTCCS